MSTQALLYWITRLDYIHNFAIIFLLLGAAVSIVCLTVGYYSEEEDVPIDRKNGVLKLFKISFAADIFFIAVIILVPRTKEALIVVGAGGAIEYLKSNEAATRLPDKTIRALDKLLDGYLEDDKSKKHDE